MDGGGVAAGATDGVGGVAVDGADTDGASCALMLFFLSFLLLLMKFLALYKKIILSSVVIPFYYC